jgi:hypothetical protein
MIIKSKQYVSTNRPIEHYQSLIRKMVTADGLQLFELLKEVILVRQRDRQIRELSIRAIKRLFKIAGKVVAPML